MYEIHFKFMRRKRKRKREWKRAKKSVCAKAANEGEMGRNRGAKRFYYMGLPPRPVLTASPPLGSGLPRRFQNRRVLPPSNEGMCIGLLTQLLDCYADAGADFDISDCASERIAFLKCQKEAVRIFPSPSPPLISIIFIKQENGSVNGRKHFRFFYPGKAYLVE